MRDDMKKVLVTTPRFGSRRKNDDIKQLRRNKPSEDGDSMPTKVGMKPRLKPFSDRKHLNEYLNPLIRYLTTNCGRPWDKIYSEIKEKNPNGSAVSEHIYQHLFDYVCLHPVYKDGKVFEHGWRELSELYKPYRFYVDKEGILRQPKNRRPKYKPKKEGYIVIKDEPEGETVILIQRKSDKVWFRISYQKPVKTVVKYWSESLGGYKEYTRNDRPGFVNLKGIQLPRFRDKYPYKCKTLSKKEKKKHNLLP